MNKTREIALHILNVQKAHCQSKQEDMEQAAYYQGMRDMLDIIVSDYYSNGKCVAEENGKHKIIEYRSMSA